MMKYLSILFFLILMVWTWSIVHTESPISFETHAGIQNKMAQIIADSIKNKKPDVSDLQIEKIWTEPVQHNKIKAHFTYRFKVPTAGAGLTESLISGEGLLEQQADDGSGFDRWKLYQIKTNSDSIKFEEPMIITTGDSAATAN